MCEVRKDRRRDARGGHLAADDDLGEPGRGLRWRQREVLRQRRLHVGVDQEHAQAHVGQQRAQVGGERRLADAPLVLAMVNLIIDSAAESGR
jgi:hypothetical protein